MDWILTRFDELALSTRQYQQGSGVAPTYAPEVELAGGATYDVTGEARARAKYPYDLTYSMVVLGDDAADLQDVMWALKSKVRHYARLERTMANGETHHCMARLIGVDEPQTLLNARHKRVTLTFRVWSAWQGPRTHDSAIWDGGAIWDDAPGALWDGGRSYTLTANEGQWINFYNGGNAPVYDIRLVFESVPEMPPIHTIEMISYGGVIDLTWEGTLEYPSTLTIDCGAMALDMSVSGVFGTLTMNPLGGGSGTLPEHPGHTISEWLRLEPGVTRLLITIYNDDGYETECALSALYQYAYE